MARIPYEDPSVGQPYPHNPPAITDSDRLARLEDLVIELERMIKIVANGSIEMMDRHLKQEHPSE